MQAILNFFRRNTLGVILCGAVAVLATIIGNIVPLHLVSASVIALLIGLALSKLLGSRKLLERGIVFTHKKLLKLAIILMGASLSFGQIAYVGGFSLIVMTFTLIAAFGFGWLFGRLFKMNWKLSSLISAGTGICGGSAIAAISPVIKAKQSDIAYAITATFIFDILMVIAFPIIGRAIGISDLGYGLWVGTAVNDTSSVVAAGYAFSDIAGNYSIIVKLTRTLSIIPIVVIFAIIGSRLNREQEAITVTTLAPDTATALASDTATALTPDTVGSTTISPPTKVRVNFVKIFPWFILGFLAVVAINSIGLISTNTADILSQISKFAMVMALGAIGLNTNIDELKKSGFKPMLHGFIISMLVVIVAFLVQLMFGQVF